MRSRPALPGRRGPGGSWPRCSWRCPGRRPRRPTRVGYDVSYPQCGTALPRDRAFAVVGVNGGLSTRANPCLAAQLAWAWGSSGAVREQPRAQVYLNTANPGELRTQVTTWPDDGHDALRHLRRHQLDGLLVAVRLGARAEQRRRLLHPRGARGRRRRPAQPLHLVAGRRDDEHLAERLAPPRWRATGRRSRA